MGSAKERWTGVDLNPRLTAPRRLIDELIEEIFSAESIESRVKSFGLSKNRSDVLTPLGL